jgi:benzoyl-CoA 2,3-dioxygenase component B
MSKVDLTQKIPNNVNLADNRRLQRALEEWQPAYLDWWGDLGPVGTSETEVYLRTAIEVKGDGWAHFDMVKLPDYRWGIFLADPADDAKINFGTHKGDPVWTDVPGEYRAELRRLIVTQGDTEPASVEQQRRLGATCPSLYDLRNLFQVNVEEGRHLWAMVYLLHAFFGRDGREEAEELLSRHSGDPDKPRILEAFNEPVDDWLSFFLFTYFQDRDGKYQLCSLAESGFDPLARTCQFMLTEEAHHMFVGESGVSRVIRRSVELIKEHDTMDIRKFGGVDLPTLQKYLNFHFSICLDLFGQEQSTNAANYFTMGLKGRFEETKIDDDHVLDGSVYDVPVVEHHKIGSIEVPALMAINERLRTDYIEDSQKGVDRWNKIIADAGVDFKLTLPHRGFHRNIGTFAGQHISPEGEVMTETDWSAKEHHWLPTDDDRAFVRSLMVQVTEPGKFAAWVAPPARGIHGQALDFEYVKFH